MQKCMISRWDKFEKWFCAPIYFVLGLIMIAFGLFTIKTMSFAGKVAGLCIVIIGFELWHFLILWVLVKTRKYEIDSNGIAIYYFKKMCFKKYLWNDINNICVCDVDFAIKDRNVCSIIIRIAVEDEKYGPFSKVQKRTFYGDEKWRLGRYVYTHWRNVINLTYNKDRYDQIKALSGREITDFRSEFIKKRDGPLQ